MPRRTLLACLAIACLSSACGGDEPTAEGGDEADDETTDTTETETGEPTLERICDGSQDLRLTWLLSVSGVVRTSFQFEVGFYYFYVRGDCRYFVVPYRNDDGTWIETHTGVLDEDQETALVELLHYGDWDDLYGLYPEPGSSDAPLMMVHDGASEDAIGCIGDCPDAPEPVLAMRSEYKAQLEHWWTIGQPMTGPMRVIAARRLDGDPIPQNPVPWTVDLDLSSLAIPFDDMICPGKSVLVDDPATVAALRQFRLEHAEGLQEFGDFWVEVEPGVYFEIYMRDALPFEREDGLIEQYATMVESCG
jgi:hypothetical protein